VAGGLIENNEGVVLAVPMESVLGAALKIVEEGNVKAGGATGLFISVEPNNCCCGAKVDVPEVKNMPDFSVAAWIESRGGSTGGADTVL
jgi:hypothetical protein